FDRVLVAKFKWLALAFAFFGACAALGIGNSVQSNTIADVASSSFHINGWVTGVVFVIFTGLIVFGGLNRISNVAGVFVPMMAILYIGASLVILAINYDQII